ncbi:hypothetical protein A2U01_0057375, partial [Trifolium medium]|nr:hypothetical protein [Trifolium medium]
CKIFMRAEGILRDEEGGTNRKSCRSSNGCWKQVEGSSRMEKAAWWLMTIDLKAKWRIVGYALKSR